MSNEARETNLLADVIAEQLKIKIQNREYKAGDRLPVRQLCEAFNTSETPVKQRSTSWRLRVWSSQRPNAACACGASALRI